MSDLKPCPFCGGAGDAKIRRTLGEPMVKCLTVDCDFIGELGVECWNNRPSEQKLKDAIQKMLNGIDFALDEAFSRKTVSARLRECRSEAIKFLVAKTK